MTEAIQKEPTPENGELAITQTMRTWIETNINHHTNDYLIGRSAPTGYGEPVTTDVEFAGMTCDIYHTDSQKEGGHRAFIHVRN